MKGEKFKKAEEFYSHILKILTGTQIPFLIGGTHALQKYVGIKRDTGDLDVFAKSGDALRILQLISEFGYKTEYSDARWLVKIFHKDYIIDIIFATPQGICPVDDSWFEHPYLVTILGQTVKLVPLEEMIWSKSYRQDRFKFEGPDVYHLILKQGLKLNWKRLFSRMEPNWEIFFAHLINFRFIYPSEREIIPKWIMEEYINRLKIQLSTPPPNAKVCRGPLLAIDPYKIDILEWGFKNIF